jgi:hypothetical protein
MLQRCESCHPTQSNLTTGTILTGHTKVSIHLNVTASDLVEIRPKQVRKPWPDRRINGRAGKLGKLFRQATRLDEGERTG